MGRLPCLTWVKRSSSAAARTTPSFTRQAAGSWKAALIPSVYMKGFSRFVVGEQFARRPDDSLGGDAAEAVVVPLGEALRRVAPRRRGSPGVDDGPRAPPVDVTVR